MSVPVALQQQYKGLLEWNIILAYRGSIAHGMYVPNKDPNSIDDKDIQGIVIPPREYYYGLKEICLKEWMKGVQEIKSGEWDIVLFELTKAIRMLACANPNILSLLWLDKGHYINVTEAGQLLLNYRHLFVSKNAYHSYTGYAHGQLHRMTHLAFEGYMGEKRKGLVKKYGYDTKNAAHLIRLLRMNIEFLMTGELQVKRQDAQQLLEIKRGEWTLEQVKIEADRLFILSQEAFVKSTLPAVVDMERINKLSVEIADVWRNKNG